MRKQNGDHWISFSDIMTGLMVIFMFIAISYIMEVQKKQYEVENILENYENIKDSIRQDLVFLLNEELAEWQGYIEYDSTNLSIKFIGQDIQFTGNSDIIRSKFREILDDFIPPYLEVIAQEKYKDKIAEVRIEGHANKISVSNLNASHYMWGVMWSQQRAKRVLEYVVKTPKFRSLPPSTQDRLEFWLVANGYGYGRTVDKHGAYTEISDEPICEECSRRVEFRIITTSEQVISDIIAKLQKQ